MSYFSKSGTQQNPADNFQKKSHNFQVTNSNTRDLIIIAPSYGNNNLLEKCGIKLIEILLKSNFRVMLRPHLRTLRDSTELMGSINEKFDPNLHQAMMLLRQEVLLEHLLI